MMEGRRRDAGMLNYRVLVGTIGDLADHENQRLRLTAEQSEKARQHPRGLREGPRVHVRGTRADPEPRQHPEAREQAGDDREAVQEIMERPVPAPEEIRANAPKSDKAEAMMWEVPAATATIREGTDRGSAPMR